MINSLLNFKVLLTLAITALFGLSIFLWMQTPQLFEYFNQAFCAHSNAISNILSRFCYSKLRFRHGASYADSIASWKID